MKTACWESPASWSGTGGSALPSIVKVTVPVGPPCPETKAVKVTARPAIEGLSEDSSEVVVTSRFGASTVCVNSDPLLGPTFASPPYAAVTVCGPAVSVNVVNRASSTPPTIESATGVCAWPSMVNVTAPVGVPWNPAP